MRKKIISVILELGLALTLAACGNNSQTASSAVSVTSVASAPAEKPVVTPAQETLKTIGTKAEGENICKVILTNNTGKAIKGFAIMDDSMDDYGDNMLADGDQFAAGEKRELYYDTTAAKEAASGSDSASFDVSEKVMDPDYTIRLTFEDDTEGVLHSFPFGDIEEGEIDQEDDITFIQYKSVADGSDINTKEAEKTIAENEKEEQEAAQEQNEQEKAAEQAAAQEQEEAPEPKAQEETEPEREAAPEPEPEPEPEPAPQQEEAPAQQEDDDGCVGDGLTW